MLVWLIVAALASSGFAITTTKSHLAFDFQDWLANRNAPKWLQQLFSCPYCMSHYPAAIFAFQGATGVLSYLELLFAIVAGAAISTGLIKKLLLSGGS